MTLVASDGYEYADLTQRLLGEPLKNNRNDNIRCYRMFGYGEEAVRAYLEAFDRRCPQGDPGPSSEFSIAHFAGLKAARLTGKFAPERYWATAQ